MRMRNVRNSKLGFPGMAWPAQADNLCHFASKHRGFTLIEMLIVVAMLAILSGAFFTVVIFTIRSEIDVRLRSTLRQEGLSVARAVMRDAHVARGFVEAAGDAPADAKALVLDMGDTEKQKERRVAYRRSGGRLERLVWHDDVSTTVQALATHVRNWSVERSGDLARIQIEVAISRYEREFVRTYVFTAGVGRLFRSAAGEEQP